MIYDYMWDYKTLHDHVDSMQDRLRPRRNVRPYLPFIAKVPDKVPELPHFIQSRFMGLEIAHEVMAKWYERLEHFTSYPDVDGNGLVDWIDIPLLERLVCHDIWDVGLIPADVLRSLYVRLPDNAIDDPAQAETLVKVLMSINKKKGFSLEIEMVQEEVKLNLWVPWIELLRPVVQACDREGGYLHFQWMHPNQEYCEIEFKLADVLRGTSGSDKWRQEAREYLDSLDDYIHKDEREVSACLISR